jgi:hypothetical protein
VGDQVVARLDLSGGDEAVLRRDVERVLDRRLGRSAPTDQLHHHRRPNKLLLNPLQLQRTSRIKLAASKYQIAHFQFVDRKAIAVKINYNRRSCRKASDGKIRQGTTERCFHQSAIGTSNRVTHTATDRSEADRCAGITGGATLGSSGPEVIM